MTYCVAMRLHAGMVFLSDSRTNAGLDHISTFRKMTVYERPGDRVMVLMSAGNLAITQAVRELLPTTSVPSSTDGDAPVTLWTATSMFDAARVVGRTVREVHRHDAEALKENSIEFNVNLIFGGQIKGEPMRLFNIYAAGNFVEAGFDGSCYFQIGESKYGKPIIDRVVTPATPLDAAAKCALVSMDSTLKSNLTVGPPLDLLIYEEGSLKVDKLVHITDENPYFKMIHTTWGQRLRQVFDSIPDPTWHGEPSEFPLREPPAPPQAQAMLPLRTVQAPDA